MTALQKLTQIRTLALSRQGHDWDLIVALADEAIAALLKGKRSPAQHEHIMDGLGDD